MRIVKVFFLALCFMVLGGCSLFNKSTTTENIPEVTTEDPTPEITIETNVKMGEVIFNFTINDESMINKIVVVNRHTGQGKDVIDNTISIETEYNENYTYDIVIYDHNDNKTTFTSISIKPGSLSNPYEISNVEELNDIRENLKAYYILTNDIDLASVTWTPIGSISEKEEDTVSFEGNLNGNNYKIKNLTAKGDMDFFGLFVANSGIIKNIGLTNVNIDINGFVGAIAVYNYFGQIENSYATGKITGSFVGGLVGYNYTVPTNKPASINNCYADVSVEGSYAGGLVGFNLGDINNSYAIGNVSSRLYGGGLVGINQGDVNNSYALGGITAPTTDSSSRLGGLVGANSAKIANSFASGDVNSPAYGGGLIGINEYDEVQGEVISSYRYWGQFVIAKYQKNFIGNYVNNADLITESFYQTRLSWDSNVWDFTVVPEHFYPVHHNTDKGAATPDNYRLGTSANPYKISTKEELFDIGKDENNQYAYTLANDIDLAGYEWVPIETFYGEFSSSSHIIKNLTITEVGDGIVKKIGLFAENRGLLRNIELEDININVESSSPLYVGGLVGQNYNIIKQTCITSGSIEVNGFSEIGGLVGINEGNITNTHVDVDITATHYSHVSIGGLVGNQANGEISFSYTKGELSGIVESTDSTYVGGLVGKVEKGLIKNSFAINNIISNGAIGYLVGRSENSNISNSFYYENQITKDESDNDVIPVDKDYENISLATSEDLLDINWYKDIIEFDPDIWYLDILTSEQYPIIPRSSD